jgi:transposase
MLWIQIAEEKNMMILRLPAYHCELNPIDLLWAFIKNYVAANNTTT